jgi:hypothetical protein
LRTPGQRPRIIAMTANTLTFGATALDRLPTEAVAPVVFKGKTQVLEVDGLNAGARSIGQGTATR